METPPPPSMNTDSNTDSKTVAAQQRQQHQRQRKFHLASVTQGRSMLWRTGLPLPWCPSPVPPVPPSGRGGMDLRAARRDAQTLSTASRFLLSLFLRSSSESSIPP